MKKIAIVTSTRAEFGLLLPVIEELRRFEDDNLKIELIVTGTHLSDSYGYTIEEIVSLRTRIDEIVNTSVLNDTAIDISKNQSETLVKFTELFFRKKYRGVVLLGDRYEILAVAIAAGNTHTPIFHLCGGDTTEGAIDEWIRHSITKISYIHFTTNFESTNRVIQLGESPDRVYNYGSTGIDNIIKIADMNKIDVLNSIGLENCEYAVCTYHPVTMENMEIETEITSFLDAIRQFPSIDFVVTKANADQGGSAINMMLDKTETEISNLHVFASLGVRRYLSLMKHAEFVIGNSSSGIIEAPVFKIPTINIGDRQKGRLQSDSIINCKTDTKSICDSIDKALSYEFRNLCSTVKNQYGDGFAAQRIAKKIIEIINKDEIDLKKKFYDLKE